MKRILLLDTSTGSLNQGDDIINVSIVKNWPELYRDNYIMKLATHTPLYTPLQTLLYKKKLSVFKNADFKFLCGTNALYTNMLRPLPSWNINIFNCGLVQNTICLGVGIGINSKHLNFYTKYLYSKVLAKDFIHSVRDDKTKVFIESMGYRAENTGCPTLWGLTPEFCKEIPKHQSNKVVFTLTYYERDVNHDKKMIEILENNYGELYFWPQCIEDLEYLLSIIDNKYHKIHIIPANLAAYDDFLANNSVDYIGNRLHGGIYALQHKRRSIIISIDYRAERMSKDYSFTCLDRQELPRLLERKIKSEWETSINGIDFNKIERWKKQFE